MMTTVQALVWSGILTFLMLLLGLVFRTQAWSPSGVMIAFNNREGVVAPLGIGGRAGRAERNMIGGVEVFFWAGVAARAAGAAPPAARRATTVLLARLVCYWRSRAA